MARGLTKITWEIVAQRIAEKAREVVRPTETCENFAIVSIKVVVDFAGKPVGWAQPEGVKLEPQGDWFLDTEYFYQLNGATLDSTQKNS